ncbi:Tyrosine-protein kinase Src42A [Eumeta japonica]|uniref:Tyrosine-protein kinase Src42A n=1 Tax=Eumeta variegata TaxID=151549 RepID=A0A4C1UA26_EUMVA|nr:Tyrosine-protein kinase Src42A [Eumeta japonica]
MYGLVSKSESRPVVIVVTPFIKTSSVVASAVRDGDTVKHYRIRQLDEGGFFIARRTTFRTLQELVEHYSKDADGLCVALSKPCVQNSPIPHSVFVNGAIAAEEFYLCECERPAAPRSRDRTPKRAARNVRIARAHSNIG